MGYRLMITERAEELLDSLVRYLLYGIKNEQATIHLLDCVSKIYGRLEENPYQFPPCKDSCLASKDYKEAALMDMKYLIIFKIDGKDVCVLGVFYELEHFQDKL